MKSLRLFDNCDAPTHWFRVAFMTFIFMLAGYMFAYNVKFDDEREEFVQDLADTPLADTLDVTLAANVIDVFSITLNRMPSPSELKRFHDQISQGKLTYDKLKVVLESSPEYARMMRTQTNVFHGDLVPRITERQLELAVSSLFKDVFGRGYNASERDFLLEKYQLFQNDDDKMRQFLVTMRDFVDAATPVVTPQDTSGERLVGSIGADATEARPADATEARPADATKAAPAAVKESFVQEEFVSTLPTKDDLTYVTIDNLTDPPNLYARGGKAYLMPFYTSRDDANAEYLSRRNKESLTFACARRQAATTKKATQDDETWRLLQPDMDWVRVAKPPSGSAPPPAVAAVTGATKLLSGTPLPPR